MAQCLFLCLVQSLIRRQELFGALAAQDLWGRLERDIRGREMSCQVPPHNPKPGLSLSPAVPPNIEPGPLSKAVLENASVTLECLASGVPPPGKTPALGWKPPPAGPWPLNNEAGQLPQVLLRLWTKWREISRPFSYFSNFPFFSIAVYPIPITCQSAHLPGPRAFALGSETNTQGFCSGCKFTGLPGGWEWGPGPPSCRLFGPLDQQVRKGLGAWG